MKNLVLVLFVSLFLATPAVKANEGGLIWYTNLDSAVALSNETKKPIFGFFTGSDWCGWCIKLQREVFAKPAFIEWASANVILLELDFPRTKVLPVELKEQNQKLQAAFGVQGYPTIWAVSYTHLFQKRSFGLAEQMIERYFDNYCLGYL